MGFILRFVCSFFFFTYNKHYSLVLFSSLFLPFCELSQCFFNKNCYSKSINQNININHIQYNIVSQQDKKEKLKALKSNKEDSRAHWETLRQLFLVLSLFTQAQIYLQWLVPVVHFLCHLETKYIIITDTN